MSISISGDKITFSDSTIQDTSCTANNSLTNGIFDVSKINISSNNIMTISSYSLTGTIYMYMGSTSNIPSGYLLCDGSTTNRNTYNDLFTLIGTNYGSGDGSSTFNLPDLRGRMCICTDNFANSVNDIPIYDSSNIGGNNTLNANQLASHTHTISFDGQTQYAINVSSRNNNVTANNNTNRTRMGNIVYQIGNSSNSEPVSLNTIATGETTPDEFIPQWIAVNYIIKT